MKNLVAIDIGSQCVKVLDIRGSGDRKVVKNCAIRGITENGVRVTEEQVTRAIQDIVSRMDGVSSQAVTAVSGKSVIVRNVDFPNQSKTDILRQIREEENKYIPVNLKDYFYDISIFDVPLPERKTLHGVIAAAKKETVVNQVKMINNAGLSTALVDINSLALINLYAALAELSKTEGTVTALVDIGASSTHVGIIIKGASIFSREIGIGSNMISFSICEKLNCDFDSAEKMKHAGMESVNEYAMPVVLKLVKELTMSFNFFEAESGVNVERIFFAGGGALLKGFTETISRSLEIPSEIMSPLSFFHNEAKDGGDMLKEASPAFAVCAGLALRHLD